MPDLLDNETVAVDLQADGEEEQEADANQPLISARRLSLSLKRKHIAITVMLVIFIFGVTTLVVWQSTKSSYVPTPVPSTTARPGPLPIPTIRPLPQNYTKMTAEGLLHFLFNEKQLQYNEVICLPQSPPTYKFLLKVDEYANFTGQSNTRSHARLAVSQQAVEFMFGVHYSPVPPAPQACQPI